MLFGLTGHEAIPKGEEPRQGAKNLISLRNELMHVYPQPDAVHRLEKTLRNRFPDNKLMADDTGHPWWPYHCLGAGCASRGHDAALAIVERVADELGLHPKYRLSLDPPNQVSESAGTTVWAGGRRHRFDSVATEPIGA